MSKPKEQLKPLNHLLPIPPLTLIILCPILISFLPSHFSLIQPPRPPLPILPIPNAHQLSWQLTEMAFFFHFGPNTFTNSEWGDGRADPSVFFPANFDPRQWISVAKSSGFSRVILTAKHHDGFCLWPSEYTDYSVRSSKWRDGNGDVVGELAAAAREGGVQLGIYLSPWDRHERSYGKTVEYNEYYLGQMNELLTRTKEMKSLSWSSGFKMTAGLSSIEVNKKVYVFHTVTSAIRNRTMSTGNLYIWTEETKRTLVLLLGDVEEDEKDHILKICL